uniref:ATPase family AAA domain-containing protein 2 n=1 Tax=Salmo trutta TaxID=8032 RepID=A0A673ZI25_SALTR
PSKRTRRQTSSSDTSPSPQAKGQRMGPLYFDLLPLTPAAHKDEGAGDHSHMNGHVDRKRSCQVRKSQFEHLNQSLLFDQLVNSTAEAVLQEMDNISSIRQNREVERLRMWTDTEVENMDMYSCVKRRKALRRNTFGMQTHHKAMKSHGEEEDDEAEEDDERDEAEEVGEGNDRPYNLRQRKTVQRYEAPPIVICLLSSFPLLWSRVKKHAIHSSDTTSSSDEERFERRKSKSMTRARNRCLPLNLRAEDLASGVLKDRAKVGASLADVDPMNLDTSVKFDSIGGLSNHIQSLKEMVVFPLLYPEVFERFKIQPPRGCLFYGPPGTGKTLVARALANECSQGDKKVSFFMRKGADCLSKWVGESERQLRLLFDQAYLMRPSIIFFDEIDGLAPVRSSRQDQIHSSIVSTLLALMDGLDSRGEIVVIGATNRLDSIDPALRRPGRFDREFLFNLPDKKARRQILEIHTRDWNPRLAEQFVNELAEKCVGYCGADIKALCTEATLVALRRCYPQIYGSSVKLQLDVSTIVLGPGDFSHALRTIVPASQRAQAPPGRALAPNIRPLLANTLATVLEVLLRVFPHAETQHRESRGGNLFIFLLLPLSFLVALHQPTSYRPRLLLAGPSGSGQSSHLAPAVLHHLDKLSVHLLDLPTLYSVSAKTPEESCAQVFREACRSVPSVVFMPHICDWWDSVSDTVKNTFFSLLQDVPSFTPLLILATTETCYTQLPQEVKLMFQTTYGEVVSLSSPGEEDRRRFFMDLLLVQAARAPPHRRHKALRCEEVLPVAEVPGPRVLSPEEQLRLADQEENTLRELRLFLRDVTKRLAIDKRFNIFSKPVDIEEVSDYLEVIIQPMDLSTVMTKIDTHKYLTAKNFLVDIDLICSNALEYNPDKEPSDKIIRHRACSLKDTAHAMLASELDPEFNRMCEEIKESRRKRGEEHTHTRSMHVGLPECCFSLRHSGGKNHIKRKARRRPSWGRGIIRKKKNYKKGTEPNGHHTHPHTYGISTEEESSNEAPRGQRTETQGESNTGIGPKEDETPATDDKAKSTSPDKDPQSKSVSYCKNKEPQAQEIQSKDERSSSKDEALQSKDEGSQAKSENPQAKPKEEGFQPMDVEKFQPKDDMVQSKTEQQSSAPTLATAPNVPRECVNGNESMDSLDSQALKSSETEGPTAVEGEASGEEEEVSASAVSRGTQEEDGRTGDTETGKEEQDREGTEGLSALLDTVVQRSEGYSVERLERLFSLLSQCIYQHRLDYDKTRLQEVRRTHA